MTATITHARRRGFPCRRRAGGRHRFVALLVALLAVVAGSLRAQDPRPLELPSPDTTRLYEITLRDGTTINGYIVDANGELQVRTLGGVELTLRRSDVVAVELSRGIIVGNELWPNDPSDSRLFLGPTARVPGHGRGYFGVYELFFTSGAVGIGDIGMVSAGVSLFPGLNLDEQVFYVAPKIRILNADYVQSAVGVFWIRPLTDEESAGMVYGPLPLGTNGQLLAAVSVSHSPRRAVSRISSWSCLVAKCVRPGASRSSLRTGSCSARARPS